MAERLLEIVKPLTNAFRVIQYNIMADVYSHPSMFPNCPPKSTFWNSRKNLLLPEISKFNADIICLQEVGKQEFQNDIKPYFSKKGYNLTLKENPGPNEGCCTIFNTSRYKLAKEEAYHFSSLAQKVIEDKTKLEKQNLMQLVLPITHHNVFIITLLNDIITGKRICVVNTHLYWGDRIPEKNYSIQVGQVGIMLQTIQQFLEKEKIDGIVVCGDFNADQMTESYKILSSSRGFDFKNVYESSKIGPIPYSTVTMAFQGWIDHILASKDIEVSTILQLYPHDFYAPCIPSLRFGSDHILLLSDLGFNEK